jgi:hypothetical protein
MQKQRHSALVLSALALAAGCDASRVVSPTSLIRSITIAATQLPGDGNGTKEVVEVFIQNPVNCGGGVMLTRTVEGWIQMIPLDEGGSRVQQITAYRVNYTFRNAAGDEYIVRETGIDQVYVQDGDIVVLIAGKTPQHSGVIRFNQTTGEQTFEAGQFEDLPRNRACEALA